MCKDYYSDRNGVVNLKGSSMQIYGIAIAKELALYLAFQRSSADRLQVPHCLFCDPSFI
jgi:hypothetical protein